MKSFHTSLLGLIALVLLTQGCLKPKKIAGNNPAPSAPVPATAEIYAEHVRTTAYQTPEEERLSFVLPPGFEVTLFASEPDITKPINMAFDEKGRLWVSQSSEYPVAAGPGQGNDRISILEDTDGDGRADKVQEFAKGLNIPIGIMPVKGGAIGYSIPNIYRFTDADNDGKAEKREVMLGPFGHQDTHGMINNLIRGFDGWMHASHGFANTSVIAGKDGDSVRMFSGNTFRFKLDGSRVEKTTDGRINPFGSAFDEMGYHYSADCHTLPIYQLIWGGDYTQWGKREISMGFAPTMMDYGLNSTALAGLVYYTDNQFPAEYQNNFFSGDVVTCRISRNVMRFNGSTPRASRKEDFLVSKDPWFRPVDVKLGPDGALYIADFYNRIIGHYEVPISHPGRDRVSGRIWRITYKGQARKPIDWSKASMAKLVEGLNHQVLGIRMTATDELVARFGAKAVRPLRKVVARKNTDPKQYIQALWALYQLQELPEEVLTAAINHPDVRVKVHAFKVMANGPGLTEARRSLALQGLSHADAHVQRAAAEVLGRHQDQRHVQPLLRLARQVPAHDTHLRYTALLAIKNHLQREAIVKPVTAASWNEKDSELLALILEDVKSPSAGRFLLRHLSAYPQPKATTLTYTQSIARTLPEAELGQLIAFTRRRPNAELQVGLAKAVQAGLEQRGLQPGGAVLEWYVALASDLLKEVPAEATAGSAEQQLRLQYGAEVAGRYKVAALEPQLRQLLASRSTEETVRAAAAGALMGIAAEKHAPLIAKTLNNGTEKLSMRQKAAQALSQSELPAVRALLGQGLRNAPYELQETIASLLVSNSAGKSQLLSLIRQGYAPARVLKARAVEERLLAKIEDQQRREFTALTANILPISQERQQLIEQRLAAFDPRGKSVAMGGALFSRNCSMCHQINKKGGLIGPQLDGIGNWGRQALTTKILDPNRNISENFRQYNITLKNGKTLTGLYRREEGQSLVLANPSGEEFSVAQQDIKEKEASKYTLMPDHFSSTIKKEDFDALLVFLLNTR